MPFHRPRLAPVAALAVACALLAGCGDDPPADPDAETVGAPRAEVSGDPDTWPLTGLTVQRGESVRPHPVLVLKMDNTAASAPQQGLGSADLVVEELVEGGVTRLAAFYYSELPGEEVGPVRSMRASDIGIVAPVDGTMVTSGAAPVTIRRIRGAGLEFVEEGASGFSRESSRSAPYNLFADLGEVADEVGGRPGRPADYLPFGPADSLPSGQPATSLTAQFSPGGHATTWTYRGGTYRMQDGYAAEGDEFPADTVLVLRVAVGDAGYRDPAGNPVPETLLKGKGEAMVFHGGALVRGTWSKASLDAPLELATRAGELTVPPGRTWIELVPAVDGDVTFEP